NGNRISLDSIHDCYYTFDEYGEHSHSEVINVFPARFEVSEELRKKLFSEEYYSYRANYDNSKRE
ncbi:hypothetical protein LJB92_04575, partial [Bacteroidales bacterium OttesenSCG-928-M06]|nr:hypothetical protein [Bacteroidales bacterium OttesenSCG-928-M06]